MSPKELMQRSLNLQSSTRATLLTSVALIFALLPVAGCKSRTSATDDATLATAVTTEIAGDPSLSGQQVQTAVQGGVVTLSGGVLNDAQRTIAARDAAAVRGVKEVVNNIALSSALASAPVSVQKPSAGNSMLSARTPPPPRAASREPAPIQRSEPSQPSQSAYNPPQPPPARTPPPPSYRTVNIPTGTTLPIRVTQTLDSGTTQQGDNFSGVTASDVVIDGLVAIPAGSAVTGNVDAVQEAAHFKGSSLLTVSLTGLRDRGASIPLSSDPYTVTGKGRGKNTAVKAGGGAAVGAILGGIFGGGKGAAIGAAAGGGAGAGVNAVTRGQQVQIPSETVVRFHTASAITVRVRSDATSDNTSGPDLQSRPN